MTTIIQALTTISDKFTIEQLEAFEKGLISLTIEKGNRHYSEDTVLLFGEDNANSKGNFISKLDKPDLQVYVNDGDGDTHAFNWVSISAFKSINLVVGEGYFEEQEKLKTALEGGSPNALLKLTLAEKKNRDELEQEIATLTSRLTISKGKINQLDDRVKEIFKL